MKKIILAILNTLIFLLALGPHLLFFYLFTQSGTNIGGNISPAIYFSIYNRMGIFLLLPYFLAIVISLISTVVSWRYVFNPPELLNKKWKFFLFAPLIIFIVGFIILIYLSSIIRGL